MAGRHVAMDWLRGRAKGLSVLALVALALQFGLSFDHNHLHRIFTDPVRVSLQAPSPAPGGHGDDPADICAICATAALVQMALAAVPPALPLPPAALAAPAAAERAPLVLAALRSGFRSRAPPSV